MTTQEEIDRVAMAIDLAEVSSEICLTRLVDGVFTYTLRYFGGEPPLEFDCIEDAYEHRRTRLHRARALAAIAAMTTGA